MATIVEYKGIKYVVGATGSGGGILDDNFKFLADAVEQLQIASDPTSRTFLFTKNSPETIWVINHNLNCYPSVTIIDSAGNQVMGEVLYNSLDQITLTFAGAFAGEASLNA